MSGVSSEGFHTTGSPQTSAIAVFQDQTATGKLKALMTPTTPSGCQVSMSRWPGRSERHRAAVELARQADGEVADVDHLLDLAAGLGGDLADLEADQRGEVLLVLAQQLAEALDQRPPCRGRHTPPPQEGGLRAIHGLVHAAASAQLTSTSRSPLMGEWSARPPDEHRGVDTAAARRARRASALQVGAGGDLLLGHGDS